MDDYENYLAIQIERIEDMDPSQPGADASLSMMSGLENLMDVVTQLRESAASGCLKGAVLRARVVEAEARLR